MRAPRYSIGVVGVASVLLVAAAVGVFLQVRGTRFGQGRVLFDFVPVQQGSPLTILSVTLSAPSLREPSVHLRNDAPRPVRGVRLAVLITTPESTRSVASGDIPVTLQPGAEATVTAAVQAVWETSPWDAYPTGALLTVGMASVSFADKTRWESGTPPGRSLLVASGTRLGPPVVIGRLPLWHVIGPGSMSFANTVSQYPINGALDGDRCIMTACEGTSACEYNGCMIR